MHRKIPFKGMQGVWLLLRASEGPSEVTMISVTSWSPPLSSQKMIPLDPVPTHYLCHLPTP